MEELTLSALADRFFMSYSYLSKSFHKTFHMPFQEYLRMVRMEHALEFLKNPNLSIQQIAANVGYETRLIFQEHSNPSTAFLRIIFVIIPDSYRQKASE